MMLGIFCKKNRSKQVEIVNLHLRSEKGKFLLGNL